MRCFLKHMNVLKKHGDELGIPMADVMARHGISEEDLDQIGDVEIE